MLVVVVKMMMMTMIPHALTVIEMIIVMLVKMKTIVIQEMVLER